MISFADVDTTRLLSSAMEVATLNHRLLASNIANADTPGYNPIRLDFQATLRQTLEGRGGFALRTDHPRHFDKTEYRPNFERLAFLSKNDYNKVDLDEQMANLSKNTGQFTTYARLLSRRFEQSRALLNNLRT